MKQAGNNEVDLLLRSLARRRGESVLQSGSVSGDGKGGSADHLDADELNSYAEGVMPAPARARSTEHLADCDACRSIVIGLTQATGAVNRYEVIERQVELTFWQKLTALFSTPVLHYAVPALLLATVIGIGLLALRQQRQTEFIAQNQPVTSGSPQTKTGSALSPTSQPPSTVQNETRSGTKAESGKERGDLKDQKTQLNQEEAIESESRVAKAPLEKDAARAGEGAGVAASQPSYAPEPKAAAPPSAVTLDRAEKSGELASARPAKGEDRERSRDEFRTQSDDVHGPNRSTAQRNTTALPSNNRVGGLMGARGPSIDKNKKGAEVETRTVSGRHFMREGDAWVDTAYEPSRATIKITRGSEQFRALVADEPGIRTIAEQLNGVVIVVWKNRAYQIR